MSFYLLLIVGLLAFFIGGMIAGWALTIIAIAHGWLGKTL
jgi:hypothetical protein